MLAKSPDPREEIARLKAELAALQAEALAYLAKYREVLGEGTLEQGKEFLRGFVHEIAIDPDAARGTITFLGSGELIAITQESVDLERLACDQIAKMIAQKFTGHGLARLVDAILKAQDYTTYRSPEGPDKGVDILTAPGPLGFGKPRICVQVKSGDTPVDHPTLSQLVGTMQNVQADQGLLVHRR